MEMLYKNIVLNKKKNYSIKLYFILMTKSALAVSINQLTN